MSIKFKNLAEEKVVLTIPGTQTSSGVGSKSAVGIVPFDGIIKAVYAFLGTAGITNTQTTDLTKNGSSLVASGTLLSFATTVTTPTYPGVLSVNPTLCTQGDVLRLSNTAVHSGTAALDLTVVVVVERLRGSGVAAVFQAQSF